MTDSQRPTDSGRLITFPRLAGSEPWWPKKKLAEYLDVSERTIERWTAEGMPCLRSRRTVRYQASVCVDWLARAGA
jgi:hypothetical protein